MLLVKKGDGVRLRRTIGANETGREPARHRRPTRPTDDEVRARPVEPGPDVVGTPTSLCLEDQAKERFLGHVRGELGVAGRPQSYALDRGRMVPEGRRDHLADRFRIATARAECKRLLAGDAIDPNCGPGEHHRAPRSRLGSRARPGFDIV